ncbi:3-hydroxyacyl-CoA dehydrogenase NAD-binding domain-containing protein [Novosphingobium cyanobacteriorum]|uniref:3-hydroxyacyl-CoA dehydrogenase NAD-binding domain-containing protein n=1 Tax=Novosphingobium cyanobacteriorum TaxID=3024215 RepID=A0ABT6CR27_9SPHN|nr:3-hydroxyacyl-CoA dehydrogenase NAD-binding domain-containing protein [Novosphingobium cyanobacteriorum]MDF8334952.1 3-hydroxyacyl-CoA dehydrogenase NAD-binding domain-containing protein [Novosphingobium cyanobacteriorum]
MSAVAYEVDGEVAVLTVNYPPVNALSAATRTGLGEGIERAQADEAVKAIVILGGGKTFIAGADITEFGTEKSKAKPQLKDLQKMLENSPKLTIAAIHGTALGGGLELALTAHSRVAVASAKVGLPEVNLGILPGAGGTQRLPRLTGVEVGIDLITSGKHVPAAKALDLGVVDAIVDDVRTGAIAYAREALASGKTFVPVIERNEKITNVDPAVFAEARKTVGKKARGKIAPMVIIDCIEAACTRPAVEALAFEAEKFQELYASDQRGALMHYFFAERQARKIPGIPADIQPKPINSCAIIGAGTMGGGIAMSFANAGIPVTILDLSQEALDRGMGVVTKNYGISVSRGSMSQDKMDKALSLITPTTNYDDLAQCDIVIEAALERMDVKKEIFARLDKLMKPGAILATNTSYLSIDEIASATTRPGDVVGCHFFSPANVMKLLENVRSAVTSPETIVTVMEMGKRIGKVPVLAGSTEGFIGNRMLQYYTGEAEFLLEQGATPEQIDRVATRFGMAMGPLSMRDMAGMDMAAVSRKERSANMPAGERLSPILERLVAAGRCGQKTGKGYYRYEGREKFSDPETMEIIEGVAKEFGITRREFTDDEVEARLFAPLVNEGAKEIEDGTAIRASDIDVTWVNGYGFPVHRGGPMYWGEKYGLDKIYAMALEAEKRNGPRWAPGKLLERLAKEGKGWDAA